MRVDRLVTRSRRLTLEGGTHKETQCPQSKVRVGTRDKGTKSQPDELWIHKTNAVIA